MPSFVCDACQETLKKPKLDAHTQRCRGASFSCIDCYKSFKGVEYRQHFSCISEVEKYEKKKTDIKRPAEMIKNLPSPKKEKTNPATDTCPLTSLLRSTSDPMSLSTIKKTLKKPPYSLPKREIKKLLEKQIFMSVDGSDIICQYSPK